MTNATANPSRDPETGLTITEALIIDTYNELLAQATADALAIGELLARARATAEALAIALLDETVAQPSAETQRTTGFRRFWPLVLTTLAGVLTVQICLFLMSLRLAPVIETISKEVDGFRCFSFLWGMTEAAFLTTFCYLIVFITITIAVVCSPGSFEQPATAKFLRQQSNVIWVGIVVSIVIASAQMLALVNELNKTPEVRSGALEMGIGLCNRLEVRHGIGDGSSHLGLLRDLAFEVRREATKVHLTRHRGMLWSVRTDL